MIRSAVTVSLVPEARGGPFVFWDDLPGAMRRASELGFDGIEIFAPGPAAINRAELAAQLRGVGLQLAAMGTGAGWVVYRWHLCHPELAVRKLARDYIRSMIDLAAEFGAPAIVGSMQGRHGDGVSRDAAWAWLVEGIGELGEHARARGAPLLFEPVNRYETNLVTTVDAGLQLIDECGSDNVQLLADLFHMNIEEVDVADALSRAGRHLGHVHFVDSNRRPALEGHLEYGPIARALHALGFGGFASAEALPWPNPDQAAAQTIAAFRKVLAPAENEARDRTT